MATSDIERLSRNLMYRELAGKIRGMIEEKDLWGRFIAPEREMARAFGVSRDTVRKGLEELEREGLITRRQGRGTQVRSKSSPSVDNGAGHLFVGAAGGGYADFISGIAEVAGQSRWQVSLFDLTIPAARSDFIAQIRKGAARGVILMSVVDRRLIGDVLDAWEGPVALVDHHFPDLPVTGVMEDGAGGVRSATEHLLALGHRRIGYVEPSRRELNPWKFEGYAQALSAAGIPVDEGLIAQAPGTFAEAQRAGEEVMANPNPPTAVVTASDRLAWGVWRAAELAGREVGRDFALVGYGDSAAVTGLDPELSSVRFDSAEMGRAAMRKIAESGGLRSVPGDRVLIPTQLIVRSSSKDVRPPAGRRTA